MPHLVEEEALLRQQEAARQMRLARRAIFQQSSFNYTASNSRPFIRGDNPQVPGRASVNPTALEQEYRRLAGVRNPALDPPGAAFAASNPGILLPAQEASMSQLFTPTEQVTGESFMEKAWDFLTGAGKEFARSFNPFEEGIKTRERIFRTANIASLAIPIGISAQFGARFLGAFPALRGITALTKGKIAIGALETAAISGGLEAIRDPEDRGDHGILTQMVLGGVLGGAIGAIAIPGVRAARLRASESIMRKFDDGRALVDVRSPFHQEEFVILSAQDLAAPTHFNAEAHKGLMEQLKQNGFASRGLKRSDGLDAVMIAGMTHESGMQLAADLGQSQLITKHGLIDLVEGTSAPFMPSRTRNDMGLSIPDDAWFVMPSDAGPVTIGLGMDTANLIPLEHPAIRNRKGGNAIDALIKNRPSTRTGRAVSYFEHLKGMDGRTVLSDWYDGLIRGTNRASKLFDEPFGADLLFSDAVADVMHHARVGWAGKLKISMERGVVRAGEWLGVEGLDIIGPGLREIQAKVVGSADEFQKYGLAKHFLEKAENQLDFLGFAQDIDLDMLVRGAAREEFLEGGRSFSGILEEVEKVLPGSGLTGQPMTVTELLELDQMGRTIMVGDESWEDILEEMLDYRMMQTRETLVPSGVMPESQFLEHYMPGPDGKRTKNRWEVPIQETDDVVRSHGMTQNPYLRIDEAGSEPFSILRRAKKPGAKSKNLLLEPWWDQLVREQSAYFRLGGQQRAANLMIERAQGNPEWLARVMTKMEGPIKGVGAAEDLIPFQQIGKDGPRLIRKLVDDIAPEQGVLDLDVGQGVTKQVSEFWKINDDVLWRDIERMGPMGQNLVASFIGLPAQILRASATSSFEFLTKNPIRDMTFAFVNAGVNPMAFTRGMASILKQDDMYLTWLQAGGARAALTGQTRNDIAQAVRLIDQGKMRALGGVVAHPLEAMFKVSEFLENSTRVGSFNQRFGKLMQEGKLTPTQAAEDAAKFSREASVDFGMAGSYAWMSNFRITTAFFNASLQGTDQMLRAIAKDPIGVTTRMFAAITVPSVALYMINRKDPDFRELPPWEKAIFWHVKRGTGEGTFGAAGGLVGKLLGDDPGPEDDLWIRIPKPFEPGMIAGTMVEKFLESIDDQDPQLLDEEGGKIFRQILAGFVPMPTAMVPLLENLGNQDSVTGRPIIPRGLEDVDPSLQRTKGTSAVSIALANFINGDDISEGKISPIHIDNLVNGYAGGLGMTFWRDAGNIIIRGFRRMRGQSSALGPAPARDFLQVAPGLRGMVSNFPFGPRSVEEFYDLAERSRIASRTASYLKNSLQVDDYADWVKAHSMLWATDAMNRRLLDQMAGLRRQRQQIDIAQMDPEAKRRAIYQLDRAMMKLTSTHVKAMKDLGIRPQGPPSLLGRAAEAVGVRPGV